MKEPVEKKEKAGKISVFRSIGAWFLWFAVTLGVLVFLFYLSACIPRSAIRENLLASAEYLLESETLFYQLKEGDRRTELHNYADATTFNILYSIDGKDRLREILISPFYTDQVNMDKSVTELLVERIAGEKTADTLYDRYWHGMVLLLRPLLLLFTIQGIRFLFLGIVAALMLWLTVLLVRRKQIAVAVVLWGAAVLVQLPVTALCMEYVPTVLLMLVFSIAVCYLEKDREKIFCLCVVNGVCVAFFDFLTIETIAFVVPLAIVCCLWERKGNLKSFWTEAKFLIRAGASWGAAYVASYLVKWSLSGMVLSEERFTAALGQLSMRQGNQALSLALDSLSNGKIPVSAIERSGGDVLPQPISAIVINVRLLLGLSGKVSLEELALAILFGLLAIAGVIYLYRKKESCRLSYLLFLLSAIPLLRMFVLHNHSIEHCFFVYRALYGTLFCFGIGFIKIIDWRITKRRKGK